MHEFNFTGGKPYNPTDYGLPIWRDEDHQPTPEAAKAETQTNGLTVDAAKNKLCAWAMSQVGCREGVNNWNKYAENADLQSMYGWKPQNQPWCDVFVDTGFIACFGLSAACAMTYQPIGAGSALCKQSVQYYKDHGAFFHTPEIGDQIFFYANGDINHTGIVVRVDGGSVHTVEGNSSDMVAERVYSVSDSKIAGYGRPDWAVADGRAIENSATDHVADVGKKDERRFYELRLPYLRRGDTGPSVIALQFQLAGQGYYIGPDGADGDFGACTESALKEFQQNVGLTPDGIVGPDTGARLFGAEVKTQDRKESEAKADPKADSFWNNLLGKIKK